MHQKIISETDIDKPKFDYFQSGSSSQFLKSDLVSTQPSQTHIFQGNILENKSIQGLSPNERCNRNKHRLNKCQSLTINNETEIEEYSIWGDIEELQINKEDDNQLIQFLQLFKFRYERTTKEPISCYNTIQLTKRLINRHKSCKVKYFGINKLQWMDFRDWSK